MTTRTSIPAGRAVPTTSATAGGRVAAGLSAATRPLAALAAAAGATSPAIYQRNPVAIIPALRGQDLVTLLALPVLAVAIRRARQGSGRARLVWLGLLGYLGYTYAGAALGYAFAAFTLLYIALFSLSVFGLATLVGGIEPASLARQFDPAAPRRAVAGFLALIGLLLAGLELGQIGRYLADGVLPAGVAAGGGPYFVYGLDLGLVLMSANLSGRTRQGPLPGKVGVSRSTTPDGEVEAGSVHVQAYRPVTAGPALAQCGPAHPAHRRYALRQIGGRMDEVVVSDRHTAGRLTHFTLLVGDILVVDGGYGYRGAVLTAWAAGADLVLRVHPQTCRSAVPHLTGRDRHRRGVGPAEAIAAIAGVQTVGRGRRVKSRCTSPSGSVTSPE